MKTPLRSQPLCIIRSLPPSPDCNKKTDLNDDGCLDAAEVRAAASKLGVDLSEADAAAAVAAFDKNGDRLIEFSEFAAWWAERSGKKAPAAR